MGGNKKYLADIVLYCRISDLGEQKTESVKKEEKSIALVIGEILCLVTAKMITFLMLNLSVSSIFYHPGIMSHHNISNGPNEKIHS